MSRKIAYIYSLLVVCYVYLTVIFPMDPATIARRGFDVAHARVISLGIAIPMVVVWLLALYGASLLSEHAHSIKKSSDGPPLIQLAHGVQLLAWYLPLRMISKIGLNYLASLHPSWQNAVNISITYLHLLVLLTAFLIISRAAFKLTALSKARTSPRSVYGISLLFAVLSVAFCYATFNSRSGLSTNWLITTQEAIPMLLRVTTVVVPYLFMWSIGLMAAYQINLYQCQVEGELYRRELRQLSVGLILVISVSIALQFVTAVAASLQRLPVPAVLGIVYVLIIMLGLAFVTIARGVRQFKRLDGVQAS